MNQAIENAMSYIASAANKTTAQQLRVIDEGDVDSFLISEALSTGVGGTRLYAAHHLLDYHPVNHHSIVVVETHDYPYMCGGKIITFGTVLSDTTLSDDASKYSKPCVFGSSLEEILNSHYAGMLAVFVSRGMTNSKAPLHQNFRSELDKFLMEADHGFRIEVSKAVYGDPNSPAVLYLVSMDKHDCSDDGCCPYCGEELDDFYCEYCGEEIDPSYDDDGIGCRDDWTCQYDLLPDVTSNWITRPQQTTLARRAIHRDIAATRQQYRAWDSSCEATSIPRVWCLFFRDKVLGGLTVENHEKYYINFIRNKILEEYGGQGVLIASNVGEPEVPETTDFMAWLYNNEDLLKKHGIFLAYTNQMATNPNVNHHYVDQVFIYTNPVTGESI